jgi:hypothetical protein
MSRKYNARLAVIGVERAWASSEVSSGKGEWDDDGEEEEGDEEENECALMGVASAGPSRESVCACACA